MAQWLPFYTANTVLGENLQLKPMDSVSVYFLTTDKAIITKLDHNMKQIEIYTNYKISGQKERGIGHVTYFYEFRYALNFSVTVVGTDFIFSVRLAHNG